MESQKLGLECEKDLVLRMLDNKPREKLERKKAIFNPKLTHIQNAHKTSKYTKIGGAIENYTYTEIRTKQKDRKRKT